MSTLLKLLFVFTAILAVHPVQADAGEEDSFDIFKLKTSSLGCPMLILDGPCSGETSLYYFKCCRQMEDEDEDEGYCCFRLQDWALVLVGFLVVCIVLIIIVIIIYYRCFRAINKRTTTRSTHDNGLSLREITSTF
ncbi:hypothetical protein WR25_03579 [Diploscapter pachys]|uniref:Uncharacterized protein n=1 Tax=Diploscapter pachys TaxID=2018661 RepID=A0A2A2J441_9BILA|nr:hypothetical protein WR25_03579 [Diploscapter pachys]